MGPASGEERKLHKVGQKRQVLLSPLLWLLLADISSFALQQVFLFQADLNAVLALQGISPGQNAHDAAIARSAPDFDANLIQPNIYFNWTKPNIFAGFSPRRASWPALQLEGGRSRSPLVENRPKFIQKYILYLLAMTFDWYWYWYWWELWPAWGPSDPPLAFWACLTSCLQHSSSGTRCNTCVKGIRGLKPGGVGVGHR